MAFLFASLLSLTLAAPFPALAALRLQRATPVAGAAGEGAVLLFTAPGLDADLVASFAAEGALPALSAVMESGASAEGGLLPPFPAVTGTTLPTLLTGTWSAEHGVVGDRFYRTGSPDFADWAAWDDPGLIQTDTLPQAAERAGKQVVAVGWEGLEGLDPVLNGPVIGEPIPMSQAGVLVNFDLLTEPDAAAAQGVAYERVDLRPAEGWQGAPESHSPAQETTLTIPSLDASGPNPDRTFALYLYDSSDDDTVNYDRVLVAPEKDAAAAMADLGVGAWAGVTVELGGDRAGEQAGFWLKAIDLAPDLSKFRLYFTPVSTIAASWLGCGDRPECAAPGGFAQAVTAKIGAPVTIDPAPLAAGVIDRATFLAQGITGAWQTVDALRYVVAELGVRPDLLLLESSFPGGVARQFPDALAGGGVRSSATPVADTSSDARASLREAYTLADQLLALGRDLLGPQATTLVAAPGGLAVSTIGVNPGQVLIDAGLAEAAQPGNCKPGPVTAPLGTPDPEAPPVGPAVKACWSDGTAHIYLNFADREAAGTVAEDDYEAKRDAIIAAFSYLRDPANPDATVVAAVFRKEELRDVAGTDALHPSRTGDVVVVLAPPYRFDDSVADAAIAPVSPFAVGGYLPDAAGSGLFLAAGPRIAPGVKFSARTIDVAPTAAFLLGVPGPFNASGSILFAALVDGATLGEVTILDISDFHGQLPPLSAVADANDAEGAVNESYPVGGVEVLSPWFDRYRSQARGEVIVVTAGDAVGATPPISSVFGDEPTIEMMNALGFTADSLGNHNFDAGAAYMFGTLAPLAEFPYLSVNLVPARADATPPTGETAFQPSLLLDVGDVKLGLVGFSNPDIPDLTRPGALDPYRVIDPVTPVNAEAARLREQGAEVVIAMGHMGAAGGTLTEPTGPVVDVADQLQGVDVVIGDHTDVQVSALRPNGTLLVETHSKGVIFTRVRVVVDTESDELAYKTADFHRPWVIGMTPDPVIADAIGRLEAELAPVLGEVIASAVQPIPRADSCGMETGRTCESLIGDVITDAMRFTYGADFALTNSGGIRADLTCPSEGGDFCPPGGDNAITEGQVLTVLPFGNVVVTLDLSGEELKAMLEAGVARMPEASGAFPQVSGLCFTYDLTTAPGSRVTKAVRQAEDGSCSGEEIDLSEGATYTLATNDFTASGGDGYPDVLARANTRDILASVVAAYVGGKSALALPGEPLAPELQGRIACQGEGCPVASGDGASG
jgi:2',3'-cyclic-nucleotide 2'-phosphodiesterase (5'-nucleotidase family)